MNKCSKNYTHIWFVSSKQQQFLIFNNFCRKKFGSKEKIPTFAIPFGKFAEIAQLVEHNLAKVGVASSSLVFRSKSQQKC